MTTALLVLHVQDGIVEICGDAGIAAVERIGTAIDAARAHEVPVIHVCLEYRTGAPEANPRKPPNRFMAEFQHGAPAAQIAEPLQRTPADLVVTNTRASAFKDNDLQALLRSFGVHRLALAGLATSGVVLGTFLDASDLDYDLTVLSDGCGDPDEEIHQILFERIYRVRAEVLTVAEWASTLA